MSKACGMAVWPSRMFVIDWWRASLVRMVAPAVRIVGSSMFATEPRNAPTPTNSIARAVGIIIETLVSTLEKSKLQVISSRFNSVRVSCNATNRSECARKCYPRS